MSAALMARPRFNAGIGTPLSPPVGAAVSIDQVQRATPSSDESSTGRLSDGGWCLDAALVEAATEQVAAQLAFDTPMLTARGGALLVHAEIGCAQRHTTVRPYMPSHTVLRVTRVL